MKIGVVIIGDLVASLPLVTRCAFPSLPIRCSPLQAHANIIPLTSSNYSQVSIVSRLAPASIGQHRSPDGS
ncbi:hypothetical protein DFP72DRAFT_901480 [Ephemerocybe angulata]|uniref:Uncharacterized protein n=1 Tax=Ephemerocybe angulata TaxID=980116 RepID=A0A8H6HVI1_9AGAR|nr:hypothetical protein DFP72DRAFT_901480 [Tulosesus angulatus]